MHAVILSWMMVLSAPGNISGNWAVTMFETTSHNFGTVVKGSKTEFEFVFTNKYNEDVEIASVTSSCQCTTPSFTRGPIKTWEKGGVKVAVNTKSFVGNKNATITVRFSKPHPLEIQLHSYVVIRSDVAVDPGVVYFGTISQGKSPSITVNVNCVGRPNWRLMDVQSTCPFLQVKLQEAGRNYNQVSYKMTVYVKENAPPGRFSEFLELVTNDPDARNQRFPVQVEGSVRQSLSVSPSPLSFGLVEVGETTTKAVVVEGQEAFKITDIRSEDPFISANIKKVTDSRYLVMMRYTGDSPRQLSGNVMIMTNVDGETHKQLNFSGRVVEPESLDSVTPEPEKGVVPEFPKKSPKLTNQAEKKKNIPENIPVESELAVLDEEPVAEDLNSEAASAEKPKTDDTLLTEEKSLDDLPEIDLADSDFHETVLPKKESTSSAPRMEVEDDLMEFDVPPDVLEEKEEVKPEAQVQPPPVVRVNQGMRKPPVNKANPPSVSAEAPVFPAFEDETLPVEKPAASAAVKLPVSEKNNSSGTGRANPPKVPVTNGTGQSASGRMLLSPL